MERYRRVRVPTLAILARIEDERDVGEGKRTALAEVRRAATGRPVTIEWMDGVHDLPLQRPAALARRLERFAAGVVGLEQT